jgi:hypothetical protein
MKITIESTEPNNVHNMATSVWVGHDDVKGEQLVDLLKQVCLGYGYRPDTVRDMFNEE